MDVLLSPQPPLFPHQHDTTGRVSPPRPASPLPSSARKRKADDDGGDVMSVSPAGSPSFAARQIRPSKRIRPSEMVVGRPLTLPRLLETLDAAQLRSVLHAVCEKHSHLGDDIVRNAPRPTAASTLDVLRGYLARLNAAVPYGNASAEYSYCRVRQPLVAIVDAIADFTPQYLPPTEMQATVSLQYLDGATKIVHDLPEFSGPMHRHHKNGAYDDLSRAWALVVSEAAKRGGGFLLHSGGWDAALAKHNRLAAGRLSAAVQVMVANVGWLSAGGPVPAAQPAGSHYGLDSSTDQQSRVDQLLSGGVAGTPSRAGWL